MGVASAIWLAISSGSSLSTMRDGYPARDALSRELGCPSFSTTT